MTDTQIVSIQNYTDNQPWAVDPDSSALRGFGYLYCKKT